MLIAGRDRRLRLSVCTAVIFIINVVIAVAMSVLSGISKFSVALKNKKIFCLVRIGKGTEYKNDGESKDTERKEKIQIDDIDKLV